jgi:hypothetical protein
MSERCSFGSLAENHCPASAVWRSPSGSGYCDEHRPSWRSDLARIGPEPNPEDVLFPHGGRPDRRGRPPLDPNWSKNHSLSV